MSYAGMNAHFRGLIVFFALSAEEQASLYEDFSEEEYFHVEYGDFSTLFPLEVLTERIKSYAKSYCIWGGIEEREYFDKEICGQIQELAEAILEYAWAERGVDAQYFRRENLAKIRIWEVMRMLCRRLADEHSIVIAKDQVCLEDLLYT